MHPGGEGHLQKDLAVLAGLLEELLTDEEGHADVLEVQLGLMDRIGEENWNQLNALPTDKVE